MSRAKTGGGGGGKPRRASTKGDKKGHADSSLLATGRSFAPRVVGSVVGGNPGQQVSFSKLMRDATRALEEARRDGAELAVSP